MAVIHVVGSYYSAMGSGSAAFWSLSYRVSGKWQIQQNQVYFLSWEKAFNHLMKNFYYVMDRERLPVVVCT